MKQGSIFPHQIIDTGFMRVSDGKKALQVTAHEGTIGPLLWS
jgi:hypothetical protein